MNDIEKAVRDALAKVAGAHGVQSQPERAEAPRQPREHRPAVIDQRDSVAALRQPPKRAGVAKSERDLEGRYADVEFAVGFVTCYIHTVEKRSTGLKAYVMRLDTRERCYVLLDRLSNIRDTED